MYISVHHNIDQTTFFSVLSDFNIFLSVDSTFNIYILHLFNFQEQELLNILASPIVTCVILAIRFAQNWIMSVSRWFGKSSVS